MAEKTNKLETEKVVIADQEVKIEQNPEVNEVKSAEVKQEVDYSKKVEELKVTGKELVTKVKELLRESNIRRIKIKKEGKTIMEVPLSVATVGIILAPVLAAIGALAAVLTECTIEVERAE